MTTQAEQKVTGTYIYCVLPSTEEDVKELGAAIDASQSLRTVREDGLVAIISDAVRDKYDPSRANISAHEGVVHHAFEHGDVLPMRFGTVAQNEGAVQRFLHDKHDDLEHSLGHLHGRVEMALKVSWDRDLMFREILGEDENVRSLREQVLAQPGEAAHEARVELGRLVTEALERRRTTMSNRILDALRPQAVDVEVQRQLSENMVLNAAFLVERSALDAFDEAVSAIAVRGDAGLLNFKYVGPLPPYSFVKIVVPKEG